MRIALSAIALLACTLCLPLSAAETPSPKEKLATSKAAWDKAAKESKGNYEYTVRFSSFTGAGNETVILVKDAKIVERRFRSFSGGPPRPVPPGEQPKEDGTSWTERGDELGTHKEGAPLKTIDDLYAEAAKIVDQPLKDFERFYFGVDKSGLLQHCFIVDTRIADDAPLKGVNIASIKLHTAK